MSIRKLWRATMHATASVSAVGDRVRLLHNLTIVYPKKGNSGRASDGIKVFLTDFEQNERKKWAKMESYVREAANVLKIL